MRKLLKTGFKRYTNKIIINIKESAATQLFLPAERIKEKELFKIKYMKDKKNDTGNQAGNRQQKIVKENMQESYKDDCNSDMSVSDLAAYMDAQEDLNKGDK